MRIQNPGLCKTGGKNPRWYFRPFYDRLQSDGTTKSVQERVYIGDVAAMTKRDAEVLKRRMLDTINRRQYVVQAQIPFGEFLDQYLREFVRSSGNLATPTQAKYEGLVANYIRPAFGKLCMAQITTREIERFLATVVKKSDGKLPSQATKTDIRNVLSGIFTVARKWGYWKDANPTLDVNVGRAKAVYQQRKLTDEETRRILTALPADVRIICMVALFTTMRISEVMGLMWKHLDFQRGIFLVRQRFHRGDLDVTKSEKSSRDLPMGHLSDELKRMYPGPGFEDTYVFNVEAHYRSGRVRGIMRDDRNINAHFLRPVAQALGIYWKGFGFHAFRREAITELTNTMGITAASKAAGHSSTRMTFDYNLLDTVKREQAVRAHQERLMGKPEGGVN